jgi:hypothetical protein
MISKYLSLSEVTYSETAKRKGIVNAPNEDQIENLRYIALNIFDKVRSHFNVPLGCSSGFRSEKLNAAIGGSVTSQHRKGEALDIDADIFGRITNLAIFDFIRDNLEFDQLILEYWKDGKAGWVHVSLKRVVNIKQVLVMTKPYGNIQYTNYDNFNLNG